MKYDSANNITHKNDNKYNYDMLNQLIFANLKGKFENNPAEEEHLTFQEIDDYDGQKILENQVEQLDVIELDYAAGSIGIDLEGTFPVTKLTLTPDNPVNRVKEKDIEVYSSNDNVEYTKITGWEYLKDKDGTVTLILKEPEEARYIKVKSYFDERDENFEPVNVAEFTNRAEDLIQVYYYVTARSEEYDYDAPGNRITSTVLQRNTETTNYSYYSNSNRLKSKVMRNMPLSMMIMVIL